MRQFQHKEIYIFEHPVTIFFIFFYCKKET
jgi:hypothetical protein